MGVARFPSQGPSALNRMASTDDTGVVADVDRTQFVSAVMSAPVGEVSSQSTLRMAASVLGEWDVGALAVQKGRSIVGIVSERDVTRAIADGADPDQIWMDDVMSELPRYLTPGDSLSTAAAIMLEVGIRHLPVLEDGELVGMVSIRDVLKAAVK